MNFTKTALTNIQPPAKRTTYRDDKVSGLQLLVSPAGGKVFYYRKRFKGRMVMVKLGSFPEMTVHNARDKATATANLMAQGINPNEQRSTSYTFNELYQQYDKLFTLDIKSGTRTLKSQSNNETTYRIHIKPRVGTTDAANYTKAQAKRLCQSILADKGYSIHNKCLTLLKAMFNRAELDNPFEGISKVDESVHTRTRVLSKDELAKLFNAASVEHQVYQDVIMTLLLTAQRKNCVLSMEWQELDYQARTWTIPLSKMKGKKAHTVPLSEPMMELLHRRHQEAKPNEMYVFPSLTTPGKHVSEKTGGSSFWRRICTRAGLYSTDKLRNVRIHDLRRSTATHQLNSGGSLLAVSKLLGHADVSITSNVYAHLQLDQVREDLETATASMLGNTDPLASIKQSIGNLTQQQQSELREWMDSI